MNDQINNIITNTASIFGAVLGYAVGGFSILLQVLLVFVIADWVTGWVAAWMNGELRSRIGHEGIIRKVTIFILVSIAHLIDGILGEGHYIRDAVIFFYLATELLSIIENVGRMGIPMPGVLRNAVKIFQSKSGDSEEENEDAGTKQP
ncbi:toxin secretion/phage lysis holin [Fontibacillus phaseoli]|uniref:Toxin secretion/phage lysis holin n=1 Tax=Fontibacillus phaseoli TaxID=1416533 RepID=A0A369BQ80_9BACL|nr:phage holin family protein [Fontibacillus phaseoli]RCX22617.1 toxin secretion/phage lysis holin [Fontibacillus phaseoli]